MGPASNGSYIGNTLTTTAAYGAPFRTPYSEQWNGGIQRELFQGGVLSVDYVHNSTIKIAQPIDMNHVGAARTLNTAAAQHAIATTLAGCGATSIQGTLTPEAAQEEVALAIPRRSWTMPQTGSIQAVRSSAAFRPP